MRTWAVVVLVAIGCWCSAPTTTTTTAAQTSTTDCTTSLLACYSPLKNSSETPSRSCCLPLKEAVTNQKPCLCNLFNDPGALNKVNVTTAQILSLTARCNIADATPSMCSAAPSPSPAGTVTPPPPGTKASTGTANIVAWSGVSLILAIMASFLLF